MVQPGTYTVKLKIKEKEYTGTVKCVHDAGNKDMNEDSRKLVYEKAMQLQGLYNGINTLVDSISYYQQALKADSTAYAKNKNAQAFYGDLQKIKVELLATKKTSMFADEERLREKVSKLYNSFCNMESTPNATQLESINDLEKEFSGKQEEYKKAMAKHLPKSPELNKPRILK